MSKIKVKITLENAVGKYEYDLTGIYDDSQKTITYIEPDKEKARVKFNYMTKEFKRENNSLIMLYKFNKEKNGEGKVYIKGMNKTIYLTILTTKMERNGKDINIEYNIGTDKFKYKIEVLK